MLSKINSHNEWDKLKEVIVGSARQATIAAEYFNSDKIPEATQKKLIKLTNEASPQWFLDEVNEDLDNLANILKKYGAKVHRPKEHDIKKFYSGPFWTATGNNFYNVRDLHLVVGDNVIESASPRISRFYEASSLYDIWYSYFDAGFKWVSAPKPMLPENPLSPLYIDESQRKLTEEDLKHKELSSGRLEKLHKLSEKEIYFEAANTVRMGRDLLYLVSTSGNHKGAKWLQSILGNEYKVHTTDKLYRADHIDTTVMCLKPGTVLLNSKRATKATTPEIFNKWEKIWFDDVAEIPSHEINFQNDVRDKVAAELKSLGFDSIINGMCSPWVGMNFLSLDQKTVLVDKRQSKLIKLLESYKFEVITVSLRHMYTQGGGIHCATLDTVRESKLENYFD